VALCGVVWRCEALCGVVWRCEALCLARSVEERGLKALVQITTRVARKRKHRRQHLRVLVQKRLDFR
jgi:hypothetical protein